MAPPQQPASSRMRPAARGRRPSLSTRTIKRTSTSRIGAGRTRSSYNTPFVPTIATHNLLTAGREWVYEVVFLMWAVAVQWEQLLSIYWSRVIAFIRGFLG